MRDKDNDNEKIDVLSEEEKDVLTEQLPKGTGELTEENEFVDKLRTVFEWAGCTRFDGCLLDMVL